MKVQAEALCTKMEHGLVLLLPADVKSPLAMATLQHFLATLEEPLLVTKLLLKWVAAGEAGDETGTAVRAILPYLAAPNLATFTIIMETCHRLTIPSSGGLDAQEMARSMVPVLFWGDGRTAAASAQPELPPAATGGGPSLTETIGSNLQSLKARASSLIRGTAQTVGVADSAVVGAAAEAGGETAAAGETAVDADVAREDVKEESKEEVKDKAKEVAKDQGSTQASGKGEGTVPLPTVSQDPKDAAEDVDVDAGGPPAKVEAHNSEDRKDSAEADEEDAAPKPPATKVPLAGKQLESLIRVIEVCVRLFPDIFHPAPAPAAPPQTTAPETAPEEVTI
eukprot:gene21979-29040_t